MFSFEDTLSSRSEKKDHSPPREHSLAKFQLDREKMDEHGLRFFTQHTIPRCFWFRTKQRLLFTGRQSALGLWPKRAARCGVGRLCSLTSLALTELRFDVLLVILSSSRGSPEKVLSLCSGTEEAPFVQMHTSYPLTRVASTVCLYLTDCICVVSTRVPKNSWRL